MGPILQAQNNRKLLSKKIFLSQSILDVFVLQNVIDPADAEKLKAHLHTNEEVENFLVKNKLVTKDVINKAYSILLKMPYVELRQVQIPDQAMEVVPEKLARKYRIIPFGLDNSTIRIAVSRPSDLMQGFGEGLNKIFQDKGLFLELFVTGDTDFNECIKQYSKNESSKLLLKRGSLPVVFLRNRQIEIQYLHKIPLDFIEKYRVVIFGQNANGSYLIASESPDSPVVQKIISYIQKENGILLEIYATSPDDIDFVIEQLRKGPEADLMPDTEEKKLEETYLPILNPTLSNPVEEEKKKQTEIVRRKQGSEENVSIKGLFKGFLNSDAPNFTIDSELDSTDENIVSAPVAEENSSDVENKKKDDVQLEEEPVSEEKEDDKLSEINQSQDKKDESVEQEKPSIPIAETKVVSDAMSKGENGEIGSLINEDISESSQVEAVLTEGYVPKIVAAIVNFALNKKSSDIHIEPQARSLRIRCRIDGLLIDVAKTSLDIHPKIVSRIKILSKLKIDETRVPQDGRFEVAFKNREVDVRVSTLPTVHGEKIVMRILDKNQKILSLEDLGMQGSSFDKTIKAIARPWGIILSTGPTGSGKSTTLNAIINRINMPGKNIITLEDPVEYETPGINQCQVKPEIGFTFASGLRSVLRQDPNVIMVGEIRDAETAGMVTHAALTGHLVLSTLHTNDTSGSLPRLINMGIEPFLITSSIDLVIAQRLVRKICPKCKEELRLPARVVEEIKKELDVIPKNSSDAKRITPDLRFYYGKGCKECSQGFTGRIGIFEALSISPKIEELAVAKRPANEIKEVAISEGMITMKQDGILKALQGLTTIDEVYQAAINN